MNFIVAVDEGWGIGAKNGLLYDIKGDMKYFRETTTGKVVVMGDNTLFSFPNQKPLKNRVNLVLSLDKSLQVEGAKVFNNKEDLFEELKNYNDDDIFIIGGAYVYKQFYPYCKYGYITKIQDKREAEKFFDNIDLLDNWKVKTVSETFNENGIDYSFYVYENEKPIER